MFSFFFLLRASMVSLDDDEASNLPEPTSVSLTQKPFLTLPPQQQIAQAMWPWKNL